MAIPAYVDQNPWWKDPRLIEGDRLVDEWTKSSFKWRPRLAETFQWDANVLYCLRGPRQVGKTTLVKLKIKDLLESGLDPKRIFYWTCDLVDSLAELRTIVSEYVGGARSSTSERLYIFLDEISSVKDWQKAIKFLYDAGTLRDCLIVLTGSHSVDLRKATETLAGRRGEVEKLRDRMPDKILIPMKFSEYAETRNKEIREEIRSLKLLSFDRRFDLLKQMLISAVTPELERLRLFEKDLRILLDDYLITGGIPRAVERYVTTGRISQQVFDTYVDLVVRDARRWGARENILRQVIRQLIEDLGRSTSFNDVARRTEIGSHKTVAEYVEMLKDSFILSYVHQFDAKSQRPLYRQSKRVFFQDPFMFHALRAWTTGGNTYESALAYLTLSDNRKKVVSCVICNHLIRLLFNISPSVRFEYADKIFWWKDKKSQYLDFVLRLEEGYLPIKLSFIDGERRELFSLINFLKTGRAKKGLVLSEEISKAEEAYVTVPIVLFLTLV